MKPKQTKHIAILCIAVGALLMSCSNPSSKTLLLGKKNVTNGLAVSSMNEKRAGRLEGFLCEDNRSVP